MFRGKVRESWEGRVIEKKRSGSDGSNLYKKLKIELADGTVFNIRPRAELWDAVEEGDILIKESGSEPTKKS